MFFFFFIERHGARAVWNRGFFGGQCLKPPRQQKGRRRRKGLFPKPSPAIVQSAKVNSSRSCSNRYGGNLGAVFRLIALQTSSEQTGEHRGNVCVCVCAFGGDCGPAASPSVHCVCTGERSTVHCLTKPLKHTHTSSQIHTFLPVLHERSHVYSSRDSSSSSSSSSIPFTSFCVCVCVSSKHCGLSNTLIMLSLVVGIQQEATQHQGPDTAGKNS